MTPDPINSLIFAAVVMALVVLFVAGLRVPARRVGWRRWTGRVIAAGAAFGVTLLANAALYRHDVHFDVTATKAFTPSADAERVVKALATDVEPMERRAG